MVNCGSLIQGQRWFCSLAQHTKYDVWLGVRERKLGHQDLLMEERPFDIVWNLELFWEFCVVSYVWSSWRDHLILLGIWNYFGNSILFSYVWSLFILYLEQMFAFLPDSVKLNKSSGPLGSDSRDTFTIGMDTSTIRFIFRENLKNTLLIYVWHFPYIIHNFILYPFYLSKPKAL